MRIVRLPAITSLRPAGRKKMGKGTLDVLSTHRLDLSQISPPHITHPLSNSDRASRKEQTMTLRLCTCVYATAQQLGVHKCRVSVTTSIACEATFILSKAVVFIILQTKVVANSTAGSTILPGPLSRPKLRELMARCKLTQTRPCKRSLVLAFLFVYCFACVGARSRTACFTSVCVHFSSYQRRSLDRDELR